MASRVEQITELLTKDPDDVFLHYSLGMEYVSAKNFDKAVESFVRCCELDGSYLPAMVEMGKALRSAGKFSEARAVFDKALHAAKAAGQQHVIDNVQMQLDGLG